MFAGFNDSRMRTAMLCAGWFVAWTLIGFVLFGQDFAQNLRTNRGGNWHPMLLCWMTQAYTWALLGLAVRWLSRRLPIEGGRVAHRLACHVPLSVVMALVSAALVTSAGALLRIPWYLPDFRSTFPTTLAISLPVDIFTYWLLLSFWQILRGYDTYRQQKQIALQSQLELSDLKMQLATAQLTALKNQLQPHFLFNTLNGIMALVRRQDTAPAERMLAQLGDLLRHVLRDSDAHEITLQGELELVRLYLAIEEVRFQDRLQVEIDVKPDLLYSMVPNMCLQPLVENAIHHGIVRSSSAGKVLIRSLRSGDSLRIEVHNSGSHTEHPADGDPPGIGLANTRARLRGLYGEDGQVTIQAREHGGTIATLVIPYRAKPSNAPTDHSLA
jgi:two-component system LytT family sensor kinase